MTNAQQSLNVLAYHDPEYAAFSASLPSELVQTDVDLPPGLAEDVATFLQTERPELTAFFESQQATDPPGKFAIEIDPLIAVTNLAAVLFLLRTHFKIGRTPEGKFEFLLEHKPMNIETLSKVLEIIKRLLK